MADISIVVASVIRGANSSVEVGRVAGETITAGMAVYLSAANTWLKAVATSGGTALQSGYGTILGVALHAALASQPLAVQTGGQLPLGAPLLVGVFYYVSQTAAGGISLVADLGTADYSSIIGYGATVAIMQIQPMATGLIIA